MGSRMQKPNHGTTITHFQKQVAFPIFYQVFVQKVIPQIRFQRFNQPISCVQGCIAQSGGGFVFARLVTWMVKGFTRMPP